MNKENVIYTYTHTVEYYSVIKKKENSAICSNMDRLGKHYAKSNKSDGGQMPYDLRYKHRI